jgi:hypothetical protein
MHLELRHLSRFPIRQDSLSIKVRKYDKRTSGAGSSILSTQKLPRLTGILASVTWCHLVAAPTLKAPHPQE